MFVWEENIYSYSIHILGVIFDTFNYFSNFIPLEVGHVGDNLNFKCT